MNKTAREKMLANKPYIAIDPELQSMDKKAQNLLQTFNLSLPDEIEKRRKIIQNLLSIKGIGQGICTVSRPPRPERDLKIVGFGHCWISSLTRIPRIGSPMR